MATDNKPEAPSPRLQTGHTNVRLEPWMRAALKERAVTLQQAIVDEAERQGLDGSAVAPVTSSAAHRDALRAELKRGTPSQAYLSGFAEGSVAAFAVTKKQVGESLAGIRAENKKAKAAIDDE